MKSIKKETKSVDSFYTDLATQYAWISKDRDFGAQIDAISQNHEIKTSLELFAGPAEHSICLKDNMKVEAWALDASLQMKDVAVSQGFTDSDKYIVEKLPNIPMLDAKFDLILLLRYSIGYLSIEQLYLLAKNLSKILNDDGRIFIELHDLGYCLNNFSELKIKERVVLCPDGSKVNVAWPSGPLRWDDNSWTVQMPLRIIQTDKDERIIHDLELVSTERIYAFDEIKQAFGFYDLKCELSKFDRSNLFHGSRLIEVQL